MAEKNVENIVTVQLTWTLRLIHMHNDHSLFLTNPLKAGQGMCYL